MTRIILIITLCFGLSAAAFYLGTRYVKPTIVNTNDAYRDSLILDIKRYLKDSLYYRERVIYLNQEKQAYDNFQDRSTYTNLDSAYLDSYYLIKSIERSGHLNRKR